jgi:CRP-like cAMP-binding protein
MIALPKRAELHGYGPLRQKLRTLGIESEEEAHDFMRRIRVSAVRGRTEDIIAPGKHPRHSTVLLAGIACLYERLANGSRQIYAFQYPGDFCDLHRHVVADANSDVAVAAITNCSIGIVGHDDLEQLISRYPSVGRALWRATVIEASIFRKGLLNVGRQPALQRVAHLLCEQLARQEAVHLDSSIVYLSQLDVADAVGLSIVHVNRIFKELKQLGLLAKQGRSMKVTNREQLVRLARFDPNYLDMPHLLSRWQLRIAGTPSNARPTGGTGVAQTSSTMMLSEAAVGKRDPEAQRHGPPA